MASATPGGGGGGGAPAKPLTRAVVAAKVVSLIKQASAGSSQSLFQPIELLSLECNLKDDLIKNPWLNQLMATIISEGCLITPQEVKLFESCSNERQNQLITNVSKLKADRDSLQQKLSILRRQKQLLSNTVACRRKELDASGDTFRYPSKITTYELKLREYVGCLKTSLERKVDIKDSVQVAGDILEQLNKACADSVDHELDNLLDEISLKCDENDENMATVYEARLYQRLDIIKRQLMTVHKGCYRILHFYDNEKKEGTWRTELRRLVREMEESRCREMSQEKAYNSSKRLKQALNQLVNEAINIRFPNVVGSSNELDTLFKDINQMTGSLK